MTALLRPVYIVNMRVKRKRPATSVVSLRMAPAQVQRLQRKARQLGRTPSETGAMLLEEGLRRSDFPYIDFRDSVIGRQAYVVGARLAVWQVVSIVRAHSGRVELAAKHLGWPVFRVKAAMNYANAFSDEIDAALTDYAAVSATTLAQMLPQLETIVVPSEKMR